MELKKLMEHISIIPDYRQAWKVEHKLTDILLLTICAVISGAEGWEDIEDFGETHLDFLKQYGDFENGIPVHDTIASTCSMWFPVLFRFLAHSLTNVRSLGLRRAVPPLACCRGFRCCSFGDKSSDSPSNALRSSQTHETGFKCPSGHGRPARFIIFPAALQPVRGHHRRQLVPVVIVKFRLPPVRRGDVRDIA